MCGRFALTLPHDAMARLFEAVPANDLPPVPRFNICPTQAVHVVRMGAGEGARRLVAMRWGFVPQWYKTPSDGPLLINARAETLSEKPAFRAAARARRCLIPADGFYEWTKAEDGARLPWYIRRRDAAPLVMAGVWQEWGATGDRIATCAIVTTAASRDIDTLHHRMPLILDPANWPLWLGDAGHGAARLMQPGPQGWPEGRLEAWRVDPAVNSNRAEGAALRTPIEG
jgi:putative SOS response-associated peptidase YedK